MKIITNINSNYFYCELNLRIVIATIIAMLKKLQHLPEFTIVCNNSIVPSFNLYGVTLSARIKIFNNLLVIDLV